MLSKRSVSFSNKTNTCSPTNSISNLPSRALFARGVAILLASTLLLLLLLLLLMFLLRAPQQAGTAVFRNMQLLVLIRRRGCSRNLEDCRKDPR